MKLLHAAVIPAWLAAAIIGPGIAGHLRPAWLSAVAGGLVAGISVFVALYFLYLLIRHRL